MSIITLCTDFGTEDGYTAAMKGVILNINPKAIIVDATHALKKHDILAASFSINTYYKYFPERTVHVAVVDPGVGGKRYGIVLKTKQHVFIGPDNGIFTYVIKTQPYACYKIKPERNILNTFHGRDIFAPLAAELSIKWDRSLLGEKLEKPVLLDIPESIVKEKSITGKIIHIDHFGNLITNIQNDILPEKRSVSITLKRFTINGIKKTYEECERDTLCAVINSFNLLEIAVYSESAFNKTASSIGDYVVVRWL